MKSRSGDPLASARAAVAISVSEVAVQTRFGDPSALDLLIEVPHGATGFDEYRALERRLSSPLPGALEQFFHANTDFGAPELAIAIARRLASDRQPSRLRGIAVLRATVPRTFVDLNRLLDDEVRQGMTPGLPPYFSTGEDRALLSTLHRLYLGEAWELYRTVMANGGLALALHTYAPRTVEVAVDADIVRSLRAAYRPRVHGTWKLRPQIDLITADAAGVDLSPRELVAGLRLACEKRGLELAENATYHLHAATSGHALAARYPGRILCAEVRRDLLGAPWRPFRPSTVGPRKVERLAQPFAEALATAFAAAH